MRDDQCPSEALTAARKISVHPSGVCEAEKGEQMTDEREQEHVKEWNDSAPPQSSWALAADYCRELGVEKTEKRGDTYSTLAKYSEDRRWKTHYRLMAKLYYDAASDERRQLVNRQTWLGGSPTCDVIGDAA